MQQQPPPSFMKSPALFPPTPAAPLSTEDVQKVLEENKRLILAVMESQNLGKVAEAAQYRTQLQNNLWYLTAIADAAQPQPQAQPQPPTTPPSQLASFQEDNRNHHLMGGLQQQQQQQQSNVWPPPPHPMSPFERDQQHLMLLQQQQQHYHQAQQVAATHHQPGFAIFSGGGGTEVRGNRLEFLDGGFGSSSSQRNSVSGHGVGDIESFF